MSEEISEYVKIRGHGTIVIGDSILCDGEDIGGMDFGKNITCYSHIHDDHLSQKGLADRLGVPHSQVFCTEITKKLASALHWEKIDTIGERENFTGLPYAPPSQVKRLQVNDKIIEISFKKCNHILGSAEILFKINGKSILYAGDFASIIGTHVEKDVDILILDATHGQHSESQDFLRTNFFIPKSIEDV